MRSQGLLDLNEVLQHPGKTLRFDIASDLEGEEDADLLSPLQGTLEAQSTGNLLLLSGEFSGTAIADCARCGAPIEVDVSFDVEEQIPVEGVAACYGLGDHARVAPDEPFPLFEGNSLIVDKLLRQDLLLNLPLQPLCKYGWEGPCPLAKKAKEQSHSRLGRPEFERLANLKRPADPRKGDARP
jgi:uncharacterized metal-binding protein YceD (DUF177 family)